MKPPQTVPLVDLEATAELPLLDTGTLEIPAAWLRAAVEGDPATPPGEGLDEALRARIDADGRLAQELAREREQVRALREDLAIRDAAAAELNTEILEAQRRIQALVAETGETGAQLTQAHARLAVLGEAGQASREQLALANAELARLRDTQSILTAKVSELTAAREEAASVLSQERSRGDALNAEITKLRGQLQTPASDGHADAALEALQTQLRVTCGSLRQKDEELVALKESLARAEADENELRATLTERDTQLQELRRELQEATAGVAAKTEASIDALQTQLRVARGAARQKDEELAALRRTLAEARHDVLQLQGALADRDRETKDLRDELQRFKERPALLQLKGGELATRLLIRIDADAQTAHVLASRTSIGRSADNDLKVDLTSISRHHALILSGPKETFIEDLHSTNGVRVNGRRINRQALKDGDMVAIGKARFRFVIRAPLEAD
jgi:chromosome segregation ATPase